MTKHIGLVIATLSALSIGCNTSKKLETSTLPEVNVVANSRTIEGYQNYQRSALRQWDIVHTDLNLQFDWTKAYAYGHAQIQVKPYYFVQNTLTLDAKGMAIDKVTVSKNNKPLKFIQSYDNYVLKLTFDTILKATDTLWVDVTYTARPNELGQHCPRLDKANKGLFFIKPDTYSPTKPYQLWTQGETEDNSVWFPTIDKPNERMTHTVTMTVPNRMVTLSNGLMTKSVQKDSLRSDTWTMSLPHAPYLVMMAAGEFSVYKDTYKGMPVYYYVEPAFESVAYDIFKETPRMIGFFSEKLNYPFPWPKYHQVVVRDYTSGAMENTTAVIFGEFMQKSKAELAEDHEELIIAHELFHHWFGDIVTCESWANLPLNESFANYSEYLWLEYAYGKTAAEEHRLGEWLGYASEFEYKNENLIRFDYASREDMFDAHSYNKGGLILHMLRSYIGDEAFFDGLNLYLRQNEFKAVEIHQLRLAFEEVTGSDLNVFFNQWFLNKGFPEFQVGYSQRNNVLKIDITQAQLEANAPLYDVTVRVEYVDDSGRHATMVNLFKRTHQFEFPLDGTLKDIQVNPEFIVPGKVNMMKPAAMHLHAYMYNPHRFRVRIEALKQALNFPQANESNQLVALALQDSSAYIRETAVEVITKNKNWIALYKNELIQRSKTDASPKVRRKIITLSDKLFTQDEVKPLLNDWLADSSPSVQHAALEASAWADYPKAIQKAEQWMQDKTISSARLVAISRVIYANQEGNYTSFFIDNYTKLGDSNDKFEFLMYAGYYVGGQSQNDLERIEAMLCYIIEHESMWITRQGAYMGMAGIHAVLDDLVNTFGKDPKYADKIGPMKAKMKAIKSKVDSYWALEQNKDMWYVFE